MVFKVLRACGGYRIEHVRKLTVRQFRWLVKLALQEEANEMARMAICVRAAFGAESSKFSAFLDHLQKPSEEQIPDRAKAMSLGEAAGFGFKTEKINVPTR